MMNSHQTRINAEAARLSAIFVDAGAIPVETACLQPAETLLDLYGEDIRARAYVTHDPQGGEMMLRPDFTVPVVQMHMNEGAEPARYTYNGPVWRKQQAGSARTSEYLQVGFELFDRANPAASDAEVFALFARALAGKNLRASTGDLGILMAAVSGLSTIEPRKSALKRHIWRPKRFRQLLERFGGETPALTSRTALLEAAKNTAPADLCRAAGRHVGLRTIKEVTTRIEILQADASEPPIDPAEMHLLESILNMREKAPIALINLRKIEADMPKIGAALDRMEARLDALDSRGVDVQDLDFEGSYGRTTLEYYDGFVFGFYAENRADLPVIASGGRYDALCEVLGQGRTIPAVGGVIRPALIEAMGVRDGD